MRADIRLPAPRRLVDARVIVLSGLSILIAVAAGVIAQLLTALIGLVTNLAFYGRWDASFASPAGNKLGAWVVAIPVAGGILVGLMARYGSKAIRGHGIPEAMENILVNESRIPARITLLKPLSAAISIGTGGPFGAEGPIIATGGALGSLVGQLFPTTAEERKVLLAAGAAAGMAATFGSPVSAVLLAVELLLFELRPRSVVPVALAACTATAVRFAARGSAPVFAMPALISPGGEALAFYALMGAVAGLAAVWVTRAVYAIEDLFEKLPLHWMWWPALGAIPVGVIGLFFPLTLGVGYSNIEQVLGGGFALKAALALGSMKLLSWAISLGSGTSGGTLAPLFTIGGAMGAVMGLAAAALAPSLGIDPRIAALVGMAAMFAGASRALLASVVFAFETTRQPMGLLPLLGGCTAAYLVSALLMETTIMTEKIARRGIRVTGEYVEDPLGRSYVKGFASSPVTTLDAAEFLDGVREKLLRHEGAFEFHAFPVLRDGRLAGVVERRAILAAGMGGASTATIGTLLSRAPVAIFDDATLREAVDHMVREQVGRLPVLRRESQELVGILSRSDLLRALRAGVLAETERTRTLRRSG